MDKKESNVKFINQACFVIENDESYILVDPWFSGKVFNNSWALLKDTDLSEINLDKITHIVVSHEHPDHFHLPTLKTIASKTEQKIKFLFPTRNNPNVRDFVEKLGYDFNYLIPRSKYEIDSSTAVTCFKEGIDAALVFNIDDKVLLNQNDCNLDDNEVSVIQKMFPKVDALSLQFSLAGYYGNRDNKNEIETRGRKRHFDTVEKYIKAFNPKTYIPFASFVYFCKEYNKYLNDWIITPRQLREYFPDVSMQCLYYGDQLEWNDASNVEKNDIVLSKYDEIFSQPKDILKPSEVGMEDLEKAVDSFARSNPNFNRNYAPTETHLEIVDHDWNVSVNLRSNQINVIKDLEKEKLGGSLPGEEFISLFKFPWGADTLNISAAFNVYNKQKWYDLVGFVGGLYNR